MTGATAAPAPASPPTLRELLGPLDEERARAALAAVDAEAPPWFARVLVGAGTWVGAALIALFLVLTRMIEEAGVRGFLGLVLLGGAAYLRRAVRGDAGIQATLAASFGGQALVLASLGGSVHDERALVAVFVGLQAACIAAIPDATHRFLSALGGTLAAAYLAHDMGIPGGVDSVALLAGVYALAACYLDARLATSAFATHCRPVTYGLVAAFLGILLFDGGAHVGMRGVWLAAPRMTGMGLAGLLAALIALARGELGRPTLSGRPLFALAGVAALAAATQPVPALPAGLLVLGLGHLRRDPVLVGAGLAATGAGVALFYYSLATPLLLKSLILLGSGVILLLVRALALRPDAPRAAPPAGRRPEPRALALAAATLVAIGAPAGLVADKERLLATGTPVLLELRPVDPRSLMQGDYMALAYRLADEVLALGPEGDGRAVIRLDERGVGRLIRLDDGAAPLAPGEHRLRYRVRAGRWGSGVRLGAESFFFEEGHAGALDGARYGELRVAPGGTALLVGLRDAQGRALGP